MRRALPSRRRSAGLSLVELMIAMMLGLILMGGVYEIMASTRHAYRLQDSVMRRQETLRYASYLLTRDVRMSGHRGCLKATSPIVNTLNAPTDFLYDFGIGVQGFEATGTSWAPALPAGAGALTDVVEGTDVITLRSTLEPDVFVTQSMPATSANLKTSPAAWFPGGAYPFAIGDIVLISDCAAAAVFQITNLSTNGTFGNIVHNVGAVPPSPGNATQNLGRRYPAGSQLLRVQTVSYYIRASGAGSGPALWRRVGTAAPQELVEGVENLQLLYGEDTDGDLAPDDWRKASAVANWQNVVSVQVGLLVRSPGDAAGDADARTFTVVDQTVGPFTDRRLRRVVTTTVSLRNSLP